MQTLFYSLKQLIIILIVVHCESKLLTSIDNYKELISPLKPVNCFLPEHCINTCKHTYWVDPEYVFVAWFYEPFFKHCNPYYIRRGEENCCTGFTNLPRSRKECDDLCSEPCIVTHPNYMTEPGTCQILCHHESPPGIPQPCPFSQCIGRWCGTRCCPRGYNNPSSIKFLPTDHPPVKKIATKINNIIWNQGNRSMTTNVTLDWIVP